MIWSAGKWRALTYEMLCLSSANPSLWHQADWAVTVVYSSSGAMRGKPSSASLFAQIPFLPDTAPQSFDHNDWHSKIWRLGLNLIDNPLEPSSSSNSSIFWKGGTSIFNKSCHRRTSQRNVRCNINGVYIWALGNLDKFVLATVTIFMLIYY